MPGSTLQLGSPKVAAVIDERYAAEPDGWRKRRLLAVKLAAKGEYTSAQVAELCGVARSHLFVWLRRVREGGLEALLARDKPGPKEGTRRGVAPEVVAALAERMAAQQFASAEQARRWLKKEHGVERPYITVWSWLAKIRRSAASAAAGVTPRKIPTQQRHSKAAWPKSLRPLASRRGAG